MKTRNRRWSTLVRLSGRPYLAPKSGETMQSAAADGRALTIHHEGPRDAFWAEPGWHIVNVVERVIFPRPLPRDLGVVCGIRIGDLAP